MDPYYHIQVDFVDEDHIRRAFELLGDGNAFNINLQPTEASQEVAKGISHIARGTANISQGDWRAGELIIQRPHNMSKLDLQDKDLLISSYLGHGTIRLFRLNDTLNPAIFDKDVIIVPGDDTMVCILFVPTYFTVHDLLHFYIGDEIVTKQISNFRILRNRKGETGYNFMVLIKFKDPVFARNFKDEFNGKKFSKVDPETCHVVSIKEVVLKKSLFGKQEKHKIPYLLTDPFTTINDVKKPLKEVELPTCPVCLERMDSEVTGLITIPCQHTFHCSCLDKWKNSQCPVCRYSTLRLSRSSAIRQTSETNGCSTCGCHENLWICLICGNIGCGRYNSKHAIQHFEATSHCFAMDLRTQRVWDYAGDNYVHRLVQNEVDGKLVEIQAESNTVHNNSRHSTANNKDNEMETNFMRNKEYHLEYVQVLVSQLESQREYYELKIEQLQDSKNHTSEQEINPIKVEIENLKRDFKDCKLKWDQQQLSMKNQADEDRLVIRGLQDNLSHLENQKKTLEEDRDALKEENSDLKDQVQDLMFYLESQEKFKDADESVKQGTIVISQPHSRQKEQLRPTKTEVKKKSKNRKKAK